MATLTPPLPATRIELPRLLRLWHLTSLDAVTVAVTWTIAFAWAMHLSLPWWLPAIVGLSAWSLYIADRLLDARRARTPLRTRHHFHWHHRRIFLPLAVACGLTALALVFWKMPVRIEMRDSLIAAAAITYLASVHTAEETSPEHARSRRHKNWARKELLVALVFTTACAAPALTRSATRWPLLPLLVVFAALAWLNCHAIESWESVSWESASRESSRTVRLAAQWLTGLAIAASLAAALLRQQRASLLLLAAAASALLLLILDRQRPRLSETALRTLADLVLLTPLLLVALP